MKSWKSLLSSLLLAGCSSGAGSAPSGVLLIGDSITHGYAQYVTADYAIPDDNCRNSFYTAVHFQDWLKLRPTPKVIVWNNGLWNAMADTAPDLTHGRTHEQYAAELTHTARQMLDTGAVVVFTLTTKIPNEAAAVGFIPGEEDVLNQIAVQTLEPIGVIILDLNAVSQGLQEHQRSPGDVHYDAYGYQQLAAAVSRLLVELL